MKIYDSQLDYADTGILLMDAGNTLFDLAMATTCGDNDVSLRAFSDIVSDYDESFYDSASEPELAASQIDWSYSIISWLEGFNMLQSQTMKFNWNN